MTRTSRPARLRSTAQRVVDVLRTRGVAATAALVVDRVRQWVHIREEHVWYLRDLRDLRDGTSPPAWEDGVQLVPGTSERLRVLDELDSVGPNEARRRLDAGARWWLVLEGEQPLFSCWLFTGTAPVAATPGGAMAVPPDSVVLEDSVTTPAARGRGIAPRAWDALAADLAARGVRRMLTKVGTDNTSSRRAVEKAGFTGIAVMAFDRVGPWRRTTVRPVPGREAGWPLGGLGVEPGPPVATWRAASAGPRPGRTGT